MKKDDEVTDKKRKSERERERGWKKKKAGECRSGGVELL